VGSRLMLATMLAAGGLITGLAAGVAAPAHAQGGTYRERVVTVYGSDACPKATNPDEIVVCSRRPEEERYRIPRTLRDEERAQISRRDNVAVQRDALASGRPAATGIGSCSAVGPGGFIGCTPGLSVGRAIGVARKAIETATDPVDK
jgi:hypothetical protein